MEEVTELWALSKWLLLPSPRDEPLPAPTLQHLVRVSGIDAKEGVARAIGAWTPHLDTLLVQFVDSQHAA